MAERMPKEMQELLARIDNPDEIKRVQLLWNDYVAANDNYELNYPQQFANIVDGNRRFGQNKTIPTPAEQLRQYESLVMAEINDLIQEQELAKEELYELEDKQEPEAPTEESRIEQFRLSYDDMERTTVQQALPGRDIDQSQELGITWIKEWEREQQAQQPSKDNTPAHETPKQPDELKLTFDDRDNPDKDDYGIEPEEPDMDERAYG